MLNYQRVPLESFRLNQFFDMLHLPSLLEDFVGHITIVIGADMPTDRGL
jgi:hypothetical protein